MPLPMTHARFVVVCILRHSTLEAGQKRLDVRLLDPDAQDAMPPIRRDMEFTSPDGVVDSRARIIVEVNGVTFRKHGPARLSRRHRRQRDGQAPRQRPFARRKVRPTCRRRPSCWPPAMLTSSGCCDGCWKGWTCRAVTAAELGVRADPDESADTHEAIARSKAEEWSSAAGIPAIASDGGLAGAGAGGQLGRVGTRAGSRGPAASDAERQRGCWNCWIRTPTLTGTPRSWKDWPSADGGQTLASWEVSGATGRIVETLPERAARVDEEILGVSAVVFRRVRADV